MKDDKAFDVSLLITSYGIGPGSHELGLVSLLGDKKETAAKPPPLTDQNMALSPNRIEFDTVSIRTAHANPRTPVNPRIFF